jgi:hypothetical protein
LAIQTPSRWDATHEILGGISDVRVEEVPPSAYLSTLSIMKEYIGQVTFGSRRKRKAELF